MGNFSRVVIFIGSNGHLGPPAMCPFSPNLFGWEGFRLLK